MLYIQPKQNPSGAYPPPQSTEAKGLLIFPEEFLETFIQYNGFVTLNVEDETVTGITPNTEAWEAWKAEQPTQKETPASSTAVTWEELDNAYTEGVNSAYDE